MSIQKMDEAIAASSLGQGDRNSGKPAFVRLQVVRSLIFYQMEVLHASDPDLTGIRAKLAMLSRDEPSAARPKSEIRIPKSERRTVDKMRAKRTVVGKTGSNTKEPAKTADENSSAAALGSQAPTESNAVKDFLASEPANTPTSPGPPGSTTFSPWKGKKGLGETNETAAMKPASAGRCAF